MSPAEQPGLRERKRQQTHRAIYDAAVSLFLEQGYVETTLAQIAEAADVAPRTIFAYFESKEALLYAHYEPAFVALEERLARPGRKPALEETREWLADDILGGPAVDPALDQLLTETFLRVPSVAEHVSRTIARLEGHLASALAVDLGSAPGDPTPAIAAAATMAGLYKSSDFNDWASVDPARTMEGFDTALKILTHGIAGLLDHDTASGSA